jgi:putative hydrolase of the HAD superfamily
MGLRAVFLDVGNTLVHEVPPRCAIYADVARRRGIGVSDEQMQVLMRQAHAELPREWQGAYRYSDRWFEAYVAHIFHGMLGLRETELQELCRELFGRFEDPGTFRVFPGAHALLAALRGHGLVLGVISNWSARLPRVLEALDLARSFDFVLCSAIERMEKPDPAIFRAALARAGAAPSEALHAGDHPEKDASAALAVGIAPVLVDHGDRLDTARSGGFPRVRGLEELGSLILSRLP